LACFPQQPGRWSRSARSCADTHGGGPGSSPSVPPEVPVPETALRLCSESHRRLTVDLIRFRRGRNAGLSSARPPDCAPVWRADHHETDLRPPSCPCRRPQFCRHRHRVAESARSARAASRICSPRSRTARSRRRSAWTRKRCATTLRKSLTPSSGSDLSRPECHPSVCRNFAYSRSARGSSRHQYRSSGA